MGEGIVGIGGEDGVEDGSGVVDTALLEGGVGRRVAAEMRGRAEQTRSEGQRAGRQESEQASETDTRSGVTKRRHGHYSIRRS